MTRLDCYLLFQHVEEHSDCMLLAFAQPIPFATPALSNVLLPRLVRVRNLGAHELSQPQNPFNQLPFFCTSEVKVQRLWDAPREALENDPNTFLIVEVGVITFGTCGADVPFAVVPRRRVMVF